MGCKGFCVSLTEQGLFYFNCSLILNFCLILHIEKNEKQRKIKFVACKVCPISVFNFSHWLMHQITSLIFVNVGNVLLTLQICFL